MNVLDNVCFDHYRRSLLKKGVKGLILHTQSKLIHKLEVTKGQEIYKIRMFRKSLTAWRTVTQQSKYEEYKLQEVVNKLNFKRKLVLMRKWKENILFSQVRRAQQNTSLYVYRNKLKSKVIESLKLFKAASKYEKMKWRNAQKFEQVKLLTTAFKTLHWYKNKKKAIHQMEIKIDAAYCHLAAKRGFKTFRLNCKELAHRRKLNYCAEKFYENKLHEKYFDLFKHFCTVQKGIKNQEY